MDPSQGSPPVDVHSQILVDIWRGVIAAIISLIAWVANRTVNRMSGLVDKLEELEQRLDRIEERSVTEFNRNSQTHAEMQHSVKELRDIIFNLLYSKGSKD